jgi:carbonic anhydrase
MKKIEKYRFLLAVVFMILIVETTTYSQVPPNEALKRLREGNERFVAGKSTRPRQDVNRIKEVAAGQKPFAIVVGCSDSRVPNEIVFDQGLGDLFIVRTAGQVSAAASWGSIEFAEEVLGAKLIVVLGHTKCGAVSAAVNVPEVPGHIVTLINAIKPAAAKVKGMPGDPVENAIKENVRMEVAQLRELEPVLAKRVREGSIKIVGGVYNLETGKVEWLEDTL